MKYCWGLFSKLVTAKGYPEPVDMTPRSCDELGICWVMVCPVPECTSVAHWCVFICFWTTMEFHSREQEDIRLLNTEQKRNSELKEAEEALEVDDSSLISGCKQDGSCHFS